MFYSSSEFWYTLMWLFCTAVYSVLLGGFAKTRFVIALRPVLGLIAIAIFVLCVVNCVQLVHFSLGVIVTILGIFWSGVFFLGAMVVVNQDLTTKNGGVHIKEGSALYWFLIKFCELNPRKSRTLCSISWLGMCTIVVWPILSSIMLIVTVVCSLVMFLVSGKNPIFYAKYYYATQTPPFEVVKWGPVPMIPLLWGGIGGLVYLLIWLTKFSLTIMIYKLIGLVAIATLVIIILSRILAAIFPSKSYENLEPYHESGWQRAYNGALAPTGRAIRTGVKTPVLAFFQIAGVLKKRVCPPIVIDKTEEACCDD